MTINAFWFGFLIAIVVLMMLMMILAFIKARQDEREEEEVSEEEFQKILNEMTGKKVPGSPQEWVSGR